MKTRCSLSGRSFQSRNAASVSGRAPVRSHSFYFTRDECKGNLLKKGKYPQPAASNSAGLGASNPPEHKMRFSVAFKANAVQHKLIHARALSISAYEPFFGNSYIQRSEPLLLLHLLRKDEQTSHCCKKEGRKEARSAISKENGARPEELFPSSPPPQNPTTTSARHSSHSKTFAPGRAPPHSLHEEPSAGHTQQQVLLLPAPSHDTLRNGTSQSAALTHQPHDQRLELKRGIWFTHCLGYNLFLGLPDLERYPGKERRGKG